jgi:hypothetical protein
MIKGNTISKIKMGEPHHFTKIAVQKLTDTLMRMTGKLIGKIQTT